MVFAPGLKRAETPMEVMDRLSVPLESGCWEWRGPFGEKGYARVDYMVGRKRIRRTATHVAYELANAVEVPEGLEIDHLCHNHGCVNPDHLEPVIHRENIIRQRAHRMATVFTCDKGHPLRVREDGTRFCYECKAEYQRVWRAEQREKQGLLPAASHKGQRKFVCDKCGGPYEVLAIIKDRGPRYGCRRCHQEYYRNRYKRLAVESK